MFHVEKEKEGDENQTVVEYGTLQNKQSKSPHIHAETVHYRGLQAQSCVRLGCTNSLSYSYSSSSSLFLISMTVHSTWGQWYAGWWLVK